MQMELKDILLKYALENAVKFKGKANPGAVVGKILASNPEVKNDMKTVSAQINEIIKQVNSLSLEQQTAQFLSLNPSYKEQEKAKKEERKVQRKELPELKNAVQGKVITRIAPEPSKYNHLGHAASFLLNYMYSLKYDGKCILRFEDTNPDKGAQEFVEAMEQDVLQYLNIKTSQTVFVSDHLDKYYNYAEELISENKAYSCTCISENISKNRRDMTECSCRSKSIEQVKKDWDLMKKGDIEEGSMTLRLKIDMSHKNAVMRDPVIFRLCYTPHYRQKDKYKVWPMYDFENAVEEGLLGVTHVLRSNEFDSRIELQNYIRDLFKLPNPEIKQYARFNVTGAITQGREIRALIESGDYIGWDDPRLVTLRALKRRGIVSEAYYELAKTIGMSKTNSNIDFSLIASINRSILDEKADRFFFIEDFEKVKIEGAPTQEIELNIHPHHRKGGRLFKTNEWFYLSKKDLVDIHDGDLVRLMDCLNFRKKENKYIFDSLDVESYKKQGKKIIHWIPVDSAVEISILMPDCKEITGMAEDNITQLQENQVVQFERYAFCRLDSIDECSNQYKFWYGHE
jgi:glutamyl-tRNA synthetase